MRMPEPNDRAAAVRPAAPVPKRIPRDASTPHAAAVLAHVRAGAGVDPAAAGPRRADVDGEPGEEGRGTPSGLVQAPLDPGPALAARRTGDEVRQAFPRRPLRLRGQLAALRVRLLRLRPLRLREVRHLPRPLELRPVLARPPRRALGHEAGRPRL